MSNSLPSCGSDGQLDLGATYLLRMPNDGFAPGRVLETHRLWELRIGDPVPHVSTEQVPSRSESRVVGYLAIADRTVGAGSPENLEILSLTPRLVLSDDPDHARRAVVALDDEFSRAGDPVRVGNHNMQARTFVRRPTVIDPNSIRRLS
ncbi:hypothetical protein [[Kitasatospora] papulosa]|uniref:hypothetical protein n=1 Tax=[Kitasatospora] papulosa TaxID=1464011 RepID=UPI003675FF0A